MRRKGVTDGRRNNGQHPNSRAALRPWGPGEIHNPTGKSGQNFRAYSEAIAKMSAQLLPEALRCSLNHRFERMLRAELGAEAPEKIPAMYPAGVTWARANCIRLHVAAVMQGDLGASVEIREASEGRATTRFEFVSSNDKLEELLAAFRRAAEADEPDEGPQVVQ